MKTIKIIILILSSLLITECSKDDNASVETETGRGTGTLTIKGIEYELVEGIIYNNTESTGPPYNFDIDLISSPTNNGIGTATYHLLALEIYTATKDNLQSGTYNYDAEETSHAGTFSGIIAIDMIRETEDFSGLYLVKSGTASINSSDSEYEITVTVVTDKYEFSASEYDFVKTESDTGITAYYKGSLKKDVH